MASLKEFLLGPFFVNGGDGSHAEDDMFFTGKSLQFSTSNEAFMIPIYGFSVREIEPLPYFGNYYFPDAYCPFDFSYTPALDSHTSRTGNWLSLQKLIAVMFSDYNPSFSITDVLLEFSTHCPFLGDRRPPDFSALIAPLAQQGFALESILPYGDTLMLSFCWSPQAKGGAYQNSANVRCVTAQFRPKHDGSLGQGKWWSPREQTIDYHLMELFKRAGVKHPVECLSQKGVALALGSFEWKPKHWMTKSEQATKRIELIKSNSHLWNDPLALALLLKEQGLYSQFTDVKQIKRQVEKLVISFSELLR